ncbi:MAG: DUF86 domain-containing protein [Caldilineaceae bacterium]
MPRDDATLLDVMKAATQIDLFLGGMPKQAFLADAKTQSSVLYQLLVIGEAVKRLSSAFRSQHQHIPWTLIAGMRDHLIHAYDTVDWEEVWTTVTVDVPTLNSQIQPLLPRKPD